MQQQRDPIVGEAEEGAGSRPAELQGGAQSLGQQGEELGGGAQEGGETG